MARTPIIKIVQKPKHMLNFKNTVVAGLILAGGAAGPAAFGQSVDLYFGPYAYWVGGEFTAVTGPNVFNQNYASSALVNVTDVNNQVVQGFETFCIQTEVDFTPYNWGNHTPYNYAVSMASIGQPDAFPLSEGTAYLYFQFATGQLQGYDYVDTATRIADAGLLQSAIWALQGGQSYGGYLPGTGDGTTGNPYFNDALNALGSSAIYQAATSSDNFGVEILNLTVAGSDPAVAAQNQLVYLRDGGIDHNDNFTPVPDGGPTALLLGASLIGLAYVNRRTPALQRVRSRR